MSELFPGANPESNEQSKEFDASEESRKNLERIKELAEKEKQPQESDIESLKEAAEFEAIKSAVIEIDQSKEAKPSTYQTQKELKQASFDKTLASVQKKLNPTERTLSKIIHNDTVDKISNVGGKTIARPSGLFAGGVFAFLGAISVLLFANRVGFTYNYTVIPLLFIIGFIVGIVFEFLISKLKK